MSDRLTPEQRSALMARVRTRNTAPEIALRRALYATGIRGWRLHRALPGRPDLTFGRARLCVFVDGAFWHGHPDYYTPGKSGPKWDAKIRRNAERDQEVNADLARLGWEVIRIWDFEVEADATAAATRVAEALETPLTVT